MDNLEYPGAKLGRLQTLAMGMGVVGLVLWVVGFAMHQPKAWQAFLFALVVWTGAAAGSLGLLMLHHMVSGGWGFLIRRQLESASRVIPVMGVLFFAGMLLGGFGSLYSWGQAGAAAHGELSEKALWLNVPGFYVRSLAYFLIWMAFGHFIYQWGNTQDTRADLRVTNRLNLISAGGLVVMVLTTTFAMVDWIMTLTPHWFSSIIGLLYSASFGLTALALQLILFWYLFAGTREVREVPKKYLRDLGNLLLTLVMLWAYMSFSQYLLTYSGNTAEESTWYVDRQNGGWGYISLALIPFHFVLPFLVLLVGSGLKKDPRRLARIAAWILAMRFIDVFWWVAPTFRDRITDLSPSDLGAPLLIGGIWLFVFAAGLKGRRVIPAHDPRLEGFWPLEEATHHA
jgi:hypothetical protein